MSRVLAIGLVLALATTFTPVVSADTCTGTLTVSSAGPTGQTTEAGPLVWARFTIATCGPTTPAAVGQYMALSVRVDGVAQNVTHRIEPTDATGKNFLLTVESDLADLAAGEHRARVDALAYLPPEYTYPPPQRAAFANFTTLGRLVRSVTLDEQPEPVGATTSTGSDGEFCLNENSSICTELLTLLPATYVNATVYTPGLDGEIDAQGGSWVGPIDARPVIEIKQPQRVPGSAGNAGVTAPTGCATVGVADLANQTRCT